MKANKNKMFLGGTCNNSTWRDELIPYLEELGIDYFNPVVENWTESDYENEMHEKDKLCNYHLYVLTPEMKGVFSIAEVIDSIHMGENTILAIVDNGLHKSWRPTGLMSVCDLAEKRGATVFRDIDSVTDANFLRDGVIKTVYTDVHIN